MKNQQPTRSSFCIAAAPCALRPSVSMRRMFSGCPMPPFLLLVLCCFVLFTVHARAQELGSNCTATLLNHSVQLNDDGTFSLPNIPYNAGMYRVHIYCVNPDQTVSGGVSNFVALVPNGSVDVNRVDLGAPPSIPSTLVAIADVRNIQTSGGTSQINAHAFFADGTFNDVSSDPGTTYIVSNPAIATISPAGLLTAVGSGLVVVTARYDGLVATTNVNISALLDSDGDGMPDEWEIANGLNPHDPTDAAQDPDGDGLTNLQEYKLGTNPHVADTDGDGLSDGQEVKLGTNPLVADTDGDGLSDGQEVQLGTNPLVADTDGDGIPDGVEVKLGLNPLVADPTTIATGHVVGPDGKPAGAASATLFGYFTGTTDATGTFTIPYVPTDLTNLVAQVLYVAPGGNVYSGSSQPVAGVAKGTTDLGIVQLGVSSGVVRGVVTSPTGKPVAGVQVAISGAQVQLSTTTDATGTYIVTNLPMGAVVVSAADPQTGLRGTGNGTLGSGPLTVNILLGGYGSVTGSVTEPDGHQTPAGVTVQLTGSAYLSTTTNSLGQYTFAFVPVGTFSVQASDASSRHGSATGLVATTSQTVTANIQFTGAGTVSGIVEDKQNNPAANAQVILISNTSIQQQLTAQADANGHYSIANVVAGKFTVSASVPQSRQGFNQLGGTAQGTIEQDGQSVTVNIVVAAAGSASGTVLRSDGKTSAPGVVLSVKNTAITATTDANGAYQLDFVPPGPQKLAAVDPNTGDQGAAAVTITASALAQVPVITLNGLGQAVVTVNDASGNPVPSAQVTLVSDTQFTQQLTGLTNSAGQYSFSGVLAGAVTVNASGLNDLAGTGQGTVPLNGSVNITVALQPAGTIQGTVFASDGKTPAPAVNVQLDSAETALTDINGKYQFASVPSGDHLLQVIDGEGQPDSSTQKATIASQGQVVTVNLTLIDTGVVTGTVTNADGSPATAASISIKSEAPGYVRTLAGQTDINGAYTISQVPVGPVVVSALSPTGAATATATLQSAGATLTVNLKLSANTVPSVHNFYDANGFLYDLDQTGEIQSGTNSVFAGFGIPFPGRDDESLSFTLADGTAAAFTGAPFATALQNGAELAVEQDGVVQGLNVIRRIYVPPTGYMARYIETLVNTNSTAITLDVNLHSGYRYAHELRNGYTYNGTPGVVASSSGDNNFNVTSDPSTSDHWIVEGTDLDVDPFLDTNNVPPVAYVFDDGKSPLALTAGSFVTTSNHGEMSATWGKVTIPAGQTVELMHFVSQQTLRASAEASAQRLIQLPPEALAGLTGSDAASIGNFRVPVNLTSAVAALPPITGVVSGQVIASDNTTPIPNAIVSLQSTDPIYSRTYLEKSDANGNYIFQGGTADSYGDTPAIPLEGANVSAVHPVSQASSPVYTVTLSSTNPLAVQPIVFSNTGQITGTVLLTPTQVVSSGTVVVSSPSLTGVPAVPINVDGTYAVTGLPPATYLVTATIAGTILSGNTTATVATGQTVTANILIGANGSVHGQVLGADSTHTPVPNVTVYLRNTSGQSVSATTSTGGNFVFNDLPPGTYSLQAYDPASNTGATVPVIVQAGATVTQNVVLLGGASIAGTITGPSGISVSSLAVTLNVTTASGLQTYHSTSTAAGAFSFSNVVLGTFNVVVQGPQGYSGFASGNLGVAGQTDTVAVTLTQAGTVSGTVFNSDGQTPAAGIQIQIYGKTGPYQTGLVATTLTDANGNFSSSQVPLGGFTVVAINTGNGNEGQGTGTIATAGQQVQVRIVLAGLGTLKVTVLNSSSQPDAGAAISVNGPFNSSYSATSDQQGTATINNVLAGSLQVSATDPGTRLSATTQVTLAAGGTQTVTLTLQASGTVSGHVYMPDGSTPASGAILTFYGTGGILFKNFGTTSKGDGSYQLSGLPLGIYNLVVLDSNSITRAYVPGIGVTSNGQLVTQNVTFAGVGTVQGTVTNPDGTAAAGVGVQVISASKLGGVFNTSTDASGNYQVKGIPVGGFTVNAENLSAGVGGTASGTVASDGDTEVANIQMVSNVVQLTQTLTDANGFLYDVQKDGTIGRGSAYQYGIGSFWCACGNPDYNNTFHLALFQNGVENDFTGNSTGTGVTAVGGQQISIEQDDLAGLNVTRRIYVPKTGYFARYVESLSNPTSAPITVDLQVSGNIQNPGAGGTMLVATSSGDASLSTADQWLVTGDNGTNPWPLSQASLGEVFTSPGAKLPPSAASLTLPNAQGTPYYPLLAYRWNSITIAPGAVVEFMHFAVQQSLQGQAMAAVQRLVQQPPEIFAGLTGSDASSIANFAVSPSLTSTVPALVPPAAGSVSGHVYGADGASPVPSAQVIFHGADLFYGASGFLADDSKGAFNFKSVPVGNFTVSAVEPLLHFLSTAASGKFPADVTTTTQDVIYSNAAVVQGTIQAPSETAFTGGQVFLYQNTGQAEVWQTNIGAQSNFTLPVVPPGSNATPPGSYSIGLNASATGSNNVSFSSSQPINPKAGDVVNLTFNLPDTGSLNGTFFNASGAPIANVTVAVSASGQTAYTGTATTDTSGKFQFTELAVDTYTLSGTDPATQLVATATVTVKTGVATTQNLQVANGGTVNLSVALNGGGVAANSLVTITRSSDNGSYVTAGVTDSNGKLQIANVPVGKFTVIAYYPGAAISTGSVQATGNSSIASNGQTVALTIALPAVSILSGTVTSYSDAPVANATLHFYYQGSVQFDGYQATTSSASGQYSFSPVLSSQSLQLTATGPSNQFSAQVSITTAATGTLTQNLKLPVNATLVVKALDASGAPLPDHTVEVSLIGQSTTAQPYSSYSSGGQTQGDGTVTVTGLSDGTYAITLYNASFQYAGSGSVIVATTDDGKTLQATVQTGFTGTINGVAAGADGVTPAPPGESSYGIYLIDADNYNPSNIGQGALATVQSSDGSYNFPNITVGRDGYIIQIFPPYFTNATQVPDAKASGKFTADGQTKTTNVTLAIPVVSGIVYQADGVTPAPNPNVYASVPGTGAYVTSKPVVYQGISSANGAYAVAVPAPAPETSIVAEAGGLTTQAQVNVNSGDVTDTVDIALHASGTVSGTVTDQYGSALVGAVVKVQSSGSSYTLLDSVNYYNPDGSNNTTGAFSIPYVATGTITLTAVYAPYTGYSCTGTATGTLANNGDTLSLKVVVQQNTTCSSGGTGGPSAWLQPAPSFLWAPRLLDPFHLTWSAPLAAPPTTLLFGGGQ